MDSPEPAYPQQDSWFVTSCLPHCRNFPAVPAPGGGFIPEGPVGEGWGVLPWPCGTHSLMACGLHNPWGNIKEWSWPPLTCRIWSDRRKVHLVQSSRRVDHKSLVFGKKEKWTQVPPILGNGSEGLCLYLIYAEFKLPAGDCKGTAMSFNLRLQVLISALLSTIMALHST